MRKLLLGTAAAVGLVGPAVAADMAVLDHDHNGPRLYDERDAAGLDWRTEQAPG
jgi:hypothetical protein